MDRCFAFVALAPKSYTGISLDNFAKEGNKGIKMLTCNINAVSFCAKLKCLLTDEKPRRSAYMPQLKMDQFRQNMELYILSKRSTSRLCTKFLYCDCGTCFINRDIASDDLLCVRRYPFLQTSCNTTYEGACKALDDFIERESTHQDFTIIKSLLGMKHNLPIDNNCDDEHPIDISDDNECPMDISDEEDENELNDYRPELPNPLSPRAGRAGFFCSFFW